MRHPETELIAFARGELVGPAHDRVARHLDSCPACRAARDDARQALEALRHGVPEPPPIAPARYRAELRQKLEARHVRAATRFPWRWPVPLALSAGLAGALVFLAVHGSLRPAERGGSMAFEEAAIAPKLDLLRNYRVVERLDLLEDLDILKGLDSPAGRRES
jgi:anti-sigma factor RsiW